MNHTKSVKEIYLNMTIVEQITTWVNKSTNPKWWRFTIKRVLELGELSQPEYEEILQIAKMEFGIIEQSSDYETKVSAVKPIGFWSRRKSIQPFLH